MFARADGAVYLLGSFIRSVERNDARARMDYAGGDEILSVSPPRRISILHFVLARGIIEFPHFVVCAASGFRLLSAAIDGGALHRGFEARFL